MKIQARAVRHVARARQFINVYSINETSSITGEIAQKYTRPDPCSGLFLTLCLYVKDCDLLVVSFVPEFLRPVDDV